MSPRADLLSDEQRLAWLRLVRSDNIGPVTFRELIDHFAAHPRRSPASARLAGEQGRLVFAVPGSPLDPRAGGANQLIRDGATIVTAIDDIIAEVRPMLTAPMPPVRLSVSEDGGETPANDADDGDRAGIVEALAATPIEVDEIIRFTGLKPAIVRLVLIELDIAGRIEHHGGGRVSLTSQG